MKKDTEEVKKVEETPVNIIDETIEPESIITPEDIVFDDDSDMPEPQTKNYSQALKCKPLFMELFNETVNNLPYATILKNQNNEQIKLIDLVKYVEAKKNKIEVTEMDKIISFIAGLEFKYARKLMEKIEDQSKQKELFELIK